MIRRLAVTRILLLFALISVFGTMAGAAPLCLNDGSLQFYLTSYNNFGNACQIGDKLFWGFNLNNTTGNEPPATQIQVQPIANDGITNIGISFNSGGWIADPGFPVDAFISYDVATLSGAAIIEDATLSITGTLSGAGATATITETLTPTVPGNPLVATLPSAVSSHIVFASNMQPTFHVVNEINLVVDPRFPLSSSHVSVVENDFSENVSVPEPLITSLVGSGLLALGLLHRKRSLR
jgi:hypothetical protein